jgi:hypothetical protein
MSVHFLRYGKPQIPYEYFVGVFNAKISKKKVKVKAIPVRGHGGP